MKFNDDDYLDIGAYQHAQRALHVYIGIILFEFAREDGATNDYIIRNFLARTDMSVSSIFKLYQTEDFHNCWVIYRCLLDRFFHLHHLHEASEFDLFEKWSFLRQCRTSNSIRSHPEFDKEKTSALFFLTEDQKKREAELLQHNIKWARPKAADVAKRLGMHYLYDFGYDIASSHIHPMANDGEQDFHTITKLEPRHALPGHRSLLSNALLVGILIAQNGLNACSFSVHDILYEFLDGVLSFLSDGSEKYVEVLLKLSECVGRQERLFISRK